MLAEALFVPAGRIAVSSPRSPRVIVDPRLALRGLGPFVVARLSAECTVWLPSELREIVRGSHAYREHPERLVPRVYGLGLRSLDRRRDAEDIRESLAQWDAAYARGAGWVRTYHLSEHPDESLIPSHVDPGIHERFEVLARGLDQLMLRSDYDLPRGAAIASCFRDAVALAAALSRESCFILTALEADGRGAPALCNYLDAWKVAVSDVTESAGADGAALRAVLASAGLSPVEWSGVVFAAAHVVPPTLVPRLPGGEVSDDAARRLWERTKVFWHRI